MLRSLFQKIRGKSDDAAQMPLTKAVADPLDPIERVRGWGDTTESRGINDIQLRGVDTFPMAELIDADESKVKTPSGAVIALDSAAVIAKPFIGDDACGTCDPTMNDATKFNTPYAVPDQLQNWYMSQSFIGYQACAMIAQNWLVDKACSMSGEDAVRNGWALKAMGDEEELDDETRDNLEQFDKQFNLVKNLEQLNRFRNIFGIRVVIFQVKSDDPKYYEKQFNIDGVTRGSYRGMSQVDPYWMMPMLTSESTSDPSSAHFYDPEFWVINGRKYHRSHLIIARTAEPADILKPTYIFGGIPLTQRIYERVYAAERTANEAPLLAMNKRTTAIHVDMEKAVANESKFIAKLKMWVKYRDNHAVKVLGKEETMEQFDTNLSDFDSVIMNQYQLVAAIAKTPATKLMGTSPKGFNATGEFETVSYHEELESVQKHVMSPVLERHYLLLEKSLGLSVRIQHVWEPVDSMTAAQRADLNLKKAQTGQALIDAGALAPDEERNRVRDDKYSGYNRMGMDDANDKPGMSPEMLAEFEKAGAQQEKSNAAMTKATAKVDDPTAKGAQEGVGLPPSVAAVPEVNEPPQVAAQQQQTTMLDPAPKSDPALIEILKALAGKLTTLEEHLLPEGQDISSDGSRSVSPSISPSVGGSVVRDRDVVGEMPAYKLPKVKHNGMVLAIENPRGTVRRGKNLAGDEWSVKMPHHYGYIKGVKGADGDELDCFLGPNLKADQAFVINQNDPDTGEFDEHKVMLGFNSEDEARDAYVASYSSDWKGFGDCTPMSMDQFKSWIAGGECKDPLDKNCIGQTAEPPHEIIK